MSRYQIFRVFLSIIIYSSGDSKYWRTLCIVDSSLLTSNRRYATIALGYLNAIVIGIKVGPRVLNLGTTGPSNVHVGKYIFDIHFLGDTEDEDE